MADKSVACAPGKRQMGPDDLEGLDDLLLEVAGADQFEDNLAVLSSEDLKSLTTAKNWWRREEKIAKELEMLH